LQPCLSVLLCIGEEKAKSYLRLTQTLYILIYHHHYLTMSKITFSLFILLLLTSCATSKFDFATAYKFQTIKKYSSLGEKSLKVLASPEQVFPNPLAMSESEVIETASLKSIAVTSEDLIHSRLSAYVGLDNMSKKGIKRNNNSGFIIGFIIGPILVFLGYILAFLGYKRGERGSKALLKISRIILAIALALVILYVVK
jgi:hypothetical protein